MRRSKLGTLALLAGLGACRSVAAPPALLAEGLPRDEGSVGSTQPETDHEAIAATPAVPALDGRAVVVVDDPEALARLADDLDLGRMLFDVPDGTTKELRRSARYRSLVDGLEPVSFFDRSGLGGFPMWWLGHPRTSFALVGVANRFDRRDLRPGTCGETRLVHRLAHRLDDGALHYLPMTVNVVLAQPDDGEGCRVVARSWIVPEGVDAVERLTAAGGPLHPDRLGLDRVLVVETNVRVGDDDYEDHGKPGQGRNELRAFAIDGKGMLAPTDLEFHPYAKMLLVRRDVAEWLGTPGVLDSIERGTATMPKRWSWDWAPVDVDGTDAHASVFEAMWVRPGVIDRITLPPEGVTSTAAGLTHRLDGMTCQGCHSARSVAGFHLPGAGDRLRGGASAHLLAELPWRVAYVEAVAQGREPVTERRLPDDGPSGFGRSCSRNGSPVATLQCDPGFECTEAPGYRFGVCLPEEYEGPAPCKRGEPMCHAPSPWFPAGFIARPCEDDQPCAAVPTPADARKCRWSADPWACAFERATPVVVDRCAAQSDCRSGHACVEGEGDGTCLPVAVVPELRVIGHRTRLR